jgi:hypothetical protein
VESLANWAKLGILIEATPKFTNQVLLSGITRFSSELEEGDQGTVLDLSNLEQCSDFQRRQAVYKASLLLEAQRRKLTGFEEVTIYVKVPGDGELKLVQDFVELRRFLEDFLSFEKGKAGGAARPSAPAVEWKRKMGEKIPEFDPDTPVDSVIPTMTVEEWVGLSERQSIRWSLDHWRSLSSRLASDKFRPRTFGKGPVVIESDGVLGTAKTMGMLKAQALPLHRLQEEFQFQALTDSSLKAPPEAIMILRYTSAIRYNGPLPHVGPLLGIAENAASFASDRGALPLKQRAPLAAPKARKAPAPVRK